MTRTLRAVLVPHAPSLVAGGFEDRFAELKGAIAAIADELRERKPALVVVSSSSHLDLEAIRLSTAPIFQGRFGGGAVAGFEYAHPGVDADQVRNFVRRLRLAGVDAEVIEGAPLDSASAVALRLALPSGGAPILPVAVVPGSLRSAYRFGTVLGDLLAEHRTDALWIATCSLSHRLSKDAEAIAEESEEFDREILELLAEGAIDELLELPPRRMARVAADAGLAHLVPLVGFLGEGYRAEVLAYGGIFGAGNAVVGFRGGERPTGEFAPATCASGRMGDD